MPIYDYRCDDCGKIYDVFHKVREVVDDVVCPDCGSTNHTRLISAPNVSVGMASSADVTTGCSAGDVCCGGACRLN